MTILVCVSSDQSDIVRHLPMYLVSPTLLVTREHMASERFSTSSRDLSPSTVLGVVMVSRGVSCESRVDPGLGELSCTEELPPLFGGAGDSVALAPFSFAEAFSARRFSRVPRSVLPASSSDNRPDMRNRDSIRPSRFSRPSMYLALVTSQLCDVDGLEWLLTDPLGGFRFFSTCVKIHSVL